MDGWIEVTPTSRLYGWEKDGNKMLIRIDKIIYMSPVNVDRENPGFVCDEFLRMSNTVMKIEGLKDPLYLRDNFTTLTLNIEKMMKKEK